MSPGREESQVSRSLVLRVQGTDSPSILTLSCPHQIRKYASTGIHPIKSAEIIEYIFKWLMFEIFDTCPLFAMFSSYYYVINNMK